QSDPLQDGFISVYALHEIADEAVEANIVLARGYVDVSHHTLDPFGSIWSARGNGAIPSRQLFVFHLPVGHIHGLKRRAVLTVDIERALVQQIKTGLQIAALIADHQVTKNIGVFEV